MWSGEYSQQDTELIHIVFSLLCVQVRAKGRSTNILQVLTGDSGVSAVTLASLVSPKPVPGETTVRAQRWYLKGTIPQVCVCVCAWVWVWVVCVCVCVWVWVCVCVCVCVCAHVHMYICILQCVRTGLQNYGEYEVAVAAKTAVGTGPYSIAQNFTAPEGGESPTLITNDHTCRFLNSFNKCFATYLSRFLAHTFIAHGRLAKSMCHAY